MRHFLDGGFLVNFRYLYLCKYNRCTIWEDEELVYEISGNALPLYKRKYCEGPLSKHYLYNFQTSTARN